MHRHMLIEVNARPHVRRQHSVGIRLQGCSPKLRGIGLQQPAVCLSTPSCGELRRVAYLARTTIGAGSRIEDAVEDADDLGVLRVFSKIPERAAEDVLDEEALREPLPVAVF